MITSIMRDFNRLDSTTPTSVTSKSSLARRSCTTTTASSYTSDSCGKNHTQDWCVNEEDEMEGKFLAW